MNSAGINKMRKCHLMNISETLIDRMSNDLQDEWMINRDKTINGIVDDLADIWHCCCFFVKALERLSNKTTIAEFNRLNLKTLTLNDYYEPGKNSMGG